MSINSLSLKRILIIVLLKNLTLVTLKVNMGDLLTSGMESLKMLSSVYIFLKKNALEFDVSSFFKETFRTSLYQTRVHVRNSIGLVDQDRFHGFVAQLTTNYKRTYDKNDQYFSQC